jgi:hypothetical protein
MKQIYLTKKINKLVSTILVLLGLKEESLGLTTTRASRSLINYDSRNSFGLYSFKAALVFLFFVSSVQGQTVAQYAFGTGTGGTLNAMTGSTQLVASAQDDTASSVTSIGFTFTYAGTAYTQFSVNANGLMRLGSTAASSSSTGYTNSATNAGSNTPAIMPYWDDLHTGVGGKVHYLLTGTAPNRSLIVEWFVTVPRSTTASANAKFQCKLDETTNVVTFTYGSGMVANTTNSGASIGLATSSTVYNNVTTTSNTNSTSTFNTANTSAITSGVFYTFTPPVACVAPANQATALVFGTTTNAAIAGSFTAAASSPSGYLVVRSTSSTLSSGPVDGTTYASAGALGGGTVVQTPGSGLTFSDSGLTANTQYYYFIYDYNNTGCTGGPKYLTTSPLSSSKITCPAAPTAPVNSGVTDSGGTVSWTAPAGGSAASVTYTFEVYTDAARTVAFGSPVTGLTTPTYTIASGLTSGTTYYFKIKANNGSCDSAYLSTGTFTTLALAPTITSFTPSVLCTQGGQTVTISGTNLTGATAVSFNGVAAASFVVVNSTTVTAVVPVGVTDGTVTLTNPANTATSGSSYTSAPTPTISAGSPVTICSGQSTTLTGTGGATYTWSPSTGLSATTGTSVTASPTATTTYTVTGASAAGCTATATVTVTVNATPSAISVSKNPTSVCAGSVTTLTATGGTVGGSMTGTIGTGLLLTSATSQPTAFDNRWSNDWRQTIYTAADLTAAGLIAGNITSLAYNVTT